MNTIQFIISFTIMILLYNDTNVSDNQNLIKIKNPVEDILYHYDLFDF